MNEPTDSLSFSSQPTLTNATLVLAFSGWMDGGDVSTGTVRRLVELVKAKQFAEIDPEPYYIYNIPGSMEIAARLRPHIQIKDGLVQSVDMPSNRFFVHEPSNLVLFLGREPHLRWRGFRDCVLKLAREADIKRIIFVGSFGGTVPHTREPRVYATCSSAELVAEMRQYAVGRTGYQGPGSFTTYLMSQAPSAGIDMVSLVAEIPGYLQGTNPASIEAVTRRLSKILHLPLDLDSLRTASTKWELEVTSAVEQNEELAATVHKLEEQYDNELLAQAGDEP